MWRRDGEDENRQRFAFKQLGVESSRLYVDVCEDLLDETPSLDAALKALRPGDVLVITSYSRLARNVRDLIRIIDSVYQAGIDVVVLNGDGVVSQFDKEEPIERAEITVRAVFRALANFENELRSIRTRDGPDIARQVERRPGRRPALTAANVRRAQHVLQDEHADPARLCEELGVKPSTLRRYMSSQGELHKVVRKVLAQEELETMKRVMKRVNLTD